MQTQRSSLLVEAGQSLRDILREGVEYAKDGSPRVLDGLPDPEMRSRFLPFVSVHLYRVEEERTLFDPRRVPVDDTAGGDPDSAVFSGPPVYLSLHYAILPWGRDLVEQSRLLEEAIRAIMAAARRPGGPRAAHPVPIRGPFRLRFTHPFDLADQTRVMNSLGLALRPIISCSVIARLEAQDRTTVPRVRTRRLRVEEQRGGANGGGTNGGGAPALRGTQGGHHGA